MSKFQTIDTLTAYVAYDDEGEGLAAFQNDDGMWMPLIAADHERAVSLKPYAQAIATQSGKSIKMVQFSVRTEIEEILP